MNDTDCFIEVAYFFGDATNAKRSVYRCTRINQMEGVDQAVSKLVEELLDARQSLNTLEPDLSSEVPRRIFFRAYVPNGMMFERSEHLILQFVHDHGFNIQPRT